MHSLVPLTREPDYGSCTAQVLDAADPRRPAARRPLEFIDRHEKSNCVRFRATSCCPGSAAISEQSEPALQGAVIAAALRPVTLVHDANGVPLQATPHLCDGADPERCRRFSDESHGRRPRPLPGAAIASRDDRRASLDW